MAADGPAGAIRCKLEGATSSIDGGNKLRKLQYLLGEALARGCTRVATFGAAGSNHATATAVHAAAQGLRCVSFLSRQRPAPWIAGNLRRPPFVATYTHAATAPDSSPAPEPARPEPLRRYLDPVAPT